MAKVVLRQRKGLTGRQLGGLKFGKAAKNSRDGKLVLSVDVGSNAFGDDLTVAFGKNVARARRENRRVTGELDLVPAKP